jgi:hypothetical protein
MRKLHVLGAVLAALFALGVLTASSASAVTFLLAEWLVNGIGTTNTQLVETEGESEFTENLGILGVIRILCSGIFVGSIGPNGADEITELLELGTGLARITNELVETSGLTCTNIEKCTSPLVWADKLPWLTLAELMVDGTEEFFVDLLTSSGAGNPGYHIFCMGSGLGDLCTVVEGVTKLTNEPEFGDVHSEFLESFTELAGLKLSNCETAGMETGQVNGLGFIALASGATLAVSE